MVVDAVDKNVGDENPTGRTMHGWKNGYVRMEMDVWIFNG
jgi:hypothetical protein